MARYIMSHILFFITSIPTLLPAAALTTTPSSSTSSVSWRLALNFGREPSAPRGFASSGARFPVKFEAAFRADGSLIPAKDVISYTDFGGAVTRPIRRGEWERSGREVAHTSRGLCYTTARDHCSHHLPARECNTMGESYHCWDVIYYRRVQGRTRGRAVRLVVGRVVLWYLGVG